MSPEVQTATARLEVKGVRKVFESPSGPVVALERLDLQVADGEFLVIVGPSGCGKTTLLRILAGLEKPTEGQILIQGGGKSSIAMVFQEQAVFPWLSVIDNVAYGLYLKGVPKKERYEIATFWLGKVGLSGFARAYPHQLSGGMRQRVNVARAFAVNPDVLLMDEPFSAVDEQTRLLLQQEVARLCEEQGKSVVFITHSIDEALALGDRIVVMTARPGRVKAILRVPFARPRDVVKIRTLPDYGKLYWQIWGLLAEEIRGGNNGA